MPDSYFTWARNYEVPMFKRAKQPPRMNSTHADMRRGGYINTRNASYPAIRVVTRPWVVGAELDLYRDVLDKPYDPPPDRTDLHTLIGYHPTTYLRPFDHEVVLSARLETTVLLDHYRILREMARAQHFPLHHTPLCTDVGANGYCRPSRRMNKQFEPDRCAKAETTEDDPSAINRCPGDLKCSFKFQSTWLKYTRSSHKSEGGGCAMEARSVLAQLRHYMIDVGTPRVGNETIPAIGARYGYIVTDQEVILLKRVEPRGGTQNVLYVSDGFPLRAIPVNERIDTDEPVINGMLALLLIHLLAAHDDVWYIKNGARNT